MSDTRARQRSRSDSNNETNLGPEWFPKTIRNQFKHVWTQPTADRRISVLQRIAVGIFAHAVAEFLLGLAKRPGQFRQLSAAEKHQNDNQYDDEFGWTNVHNSKASNRGTSARLTCCRASGQSPLSTQPTALALAHSTPYAELLAVTQGVLEAVLAHDAAPTNFLGLFGARPALREKQIGVDAQTVRIVPPTLLRYVFCTVINKGHMFDSARRLVAKSVFGSAESNPYLSGSPQRRAPNNLGTRTDYYILVITQLSLNNRQPRRRKGNLGEYSIILRSAPRLASKY